MTTLTEAERLTWTTRLAEAEAARHALMVGERAVSVRYNDREVRFTPADMGKLDAYIAQIKSTLAADAVDNTTQRRPFTVQW